MNGCIDISGKTTRSSRRQSPETGPRFELRERLGVGAQATVYRAHDAFLQRDVAIKVLTRKEPHHRRRFRREGQIAAVLDHPNVLRVLSTGVLDGSPYLAYEIVEGSSLRDALPGLPLPERLRVLRDASLGVGHLHSRGVLHRDLKSENILLDHQGGVKVADLGLALTLDLPRLTKAGCAVGTPRTMAPERIARRRGEEPGPESDVWALGILLYEALTDRFPFPGREVPLLLDQILREAPPTPRSLRPELPAQLERVCLRALAKNPAHRFRDGLAFAQALDPFLFVMG